MASTLRLSVLVSLMCLAAAANAADQSIVTEYGYDAEGHITSTTKTLLTAPPVVQQVLPTFVRKGGNREVTLVGSNLTGASVTANAEDMGVVSIKSGASPVVTLSVPESVANGIHTLTITTALGSASASIEVRMPLPTLHATPLPLEIATGSSVTLKLSLSAAADVATSLTTAVEPANMLTLSHSPLSVAVGQSAFPEITVTGATAGQGVLRFSSTELADLALNVQVVPATGSQLPDSATGESYLAQAPPLGVMNGEPAAPTIRELAAVASLELTVMNGPTPGHILPERQTATIAGVELGVMNGATPGHLLPEGQTATIAGTVLGVVNGPTPGHLLPEGQTATIASVSLGVVNGPTPGHLLPESQTATIAGVELGVVNGPTPGHLLPERQTATIAGAELGVANGPTPDYLSR